MLSFLLFPYINKSVRLQGFNNTITSKLLYSYNPYMYCTLYNKKTITEDKKNVDVIKSDIENTEKPNKKLNAYQIFIKENYHKIKNENPFLSSKEIMIELGKEWSENKKKSL